MNELEAALRRASDDLEAHSARWALIGGFVRSLMDAGYGLITMVEQTLTDRLATVRMVALPTCGSSQPLPRTRI